MLRTVRARRRALGLGFALTVHAAFVAGLIIGREPDRPTAELPAFDVVLTPPPRPSAPRPPPPRPQQAAAPDSPAVRAILPAAEPSQAALDTDALFRAPFIRWPPPSWTRRKRCLDGPMSDAERLYCDELMAKREEIPFVPAGDRGKQADFAHASARKDAIRAYRETTNPETFPGLRCAFGGECKPAR